MVWDKNDSVATGVGSKGKDSSDGGLCGGKCAVMASAEPSFDADTVHKGEEGCDKVVGMWNGEDVDGVVVDREMVGKVSDGSGSGRCHREGEGVVDVGM